MFVNKQRNQQLTDLNRLFFENFSFKEVRNKVDSLLSSNVSAEQLIDYFLIKYQESDAITQIRVLYAMFLLPIQSISQKASKIFTTIDEKTVHYLMNLLDEKFEPFFFEYVKYQFQNIQLTEEYLELVERMLSYIDKAEDYKISLILGDEHKTNKKLRTLYKRTLLENDYQEEYRQMFNFLSDTIEEHNRFDLLEDIFQLMTPTNQNMIKDKILLLFKYQPREIKYLNKKNYFFHIVSEANFMNDMDLVKNLLDYFQNASVIRNTHGERYNYLTISRLLLKKEYLSFIDVKKFLLITSKLYSSITYRYTDFLDALKRFENMGVDITEYIPPFINSFIKSLEKQEEYPSSLIKDIERLIKYHKQHDPESTLIVDLRVAMERQFKKVLINKNTKLIDLHKARIERGVEVYLKEVFVIHLWGMMAKRTHLPSFHEAVEEILNKTTNVLMLSVLSKNVPKDIQKFKSIAMGRIRALMLNVDKNESLIVALCSFLSIEEEDFINSLYKLENQAINDELNKVVLLSL